MRAFIGIDFAPAVKQQIYELRQRLRKYALKGRWKHSDNFHLTLKFLDEIIATQTAQIDEALQQAIDRALAPLGFTPEKRQFRPHITIGQDLVFSCDFSQLREIIGEVRLEATDGGPCLFI